MRNHLALGQVGFCVIVTRNHRRALTARLLGPAGEGLRLQRERLEAALGVGIGVDYSIYLWSVLARYLDAGQPLQQAYFEALRRTGKAVLFTSASLIISVFTWIFSGLQFQVDMGILLTIMFIANAVAAVLLLPAFAAFLLKPARG